MEVMMVKNDPATPYRPSNGTEGEWFASKFCNKCEGERKWRESEVDPCHILVNTFAFTIDHPDYPKEWIEDEGGPRCTAFREEGAPSQERLDRERARYDAALAEMRAANRNAGQPKDTPSDA